MLCKTVGWASEKHKAAVPTLHRGPMPRKGSSPRQGQGPSAQGLWGSRHGPCSQNSPWIFPNNLDDTQGTWPPHNRWHQYLAGPFVTFLMAMHQGRASPARQGEMVPHKPTGVLGGVSRGAERRCSCCNLFGFPKGI